MTFPFPGRRLSSACFALLLGCARLAAAEPAPEKILTVAELAALERENAMWRLVRVDDGVPANLARITKAGFTAKEVATLELKLAALWNIPVERNFGWLREEAIEEIKEIDRQFVGRMRAARLFETTGIRSPGTPPDPVVILNRQWRAAIFKVLDFDDLAEFRLMNSASSRAMSDLVKDLPVTDDELRTLFLWQREFAGARTAPSPAFANQPAWQREQQLDQWARIRGLLGDARFAVYLRRAEPAFARMQLALDNTGGTGPAAALDLWWLRQRDGWERDKEPVSRRKDELTASLKVRAVALLGEAQADKYAESQDGRWLTTPVRTVRRVSAPAPAKP